MWHPNQLRIWQCSVIDSIIIVDQWKGHTTWINKCRMKKGLVLTGGGDKVMRIWSSEHYECLEEYVISNHLSRLNDFDFADSKIVGLGGTRLCVWRRNGNRSVFASREGKFAKGICMSYKDPEAMVGCEDGTVRIFDIKWSRPIRMHSSRVDCLAVGEDLVLSGSSHGSITASSLVYDHQVATLKPIKLNGVKTLCYNPSSFLVFAGSTNGCAACWDLRKLQLLWETRVSPKAVYSMQHLRNDTSTLVIGGLDGYLRIVDQNTGKVLSICAMDQSKAELTSRSSLRGLAERRKVKRFNLDATTSDISLKAGPPIKCLAVKKLSSLIVQSTSECGD